MPWKRWNLYPASEIPFPERGTIVFICEDKESEAWLEKEEQKLDMGRTPNLKIRVFNPEEVKAIKMMTRLRQGVKFATDFLKRVRRQNSGVNTTR